MRCPRCKSDDVTLRIGKSDDTTLVDGTYEVEVLPGVTELRQEWSCNNCLIRFVTNDK